MEEEEEEEARISSYLKVREGLQASHVGESPRDQRRNSLGHAQLRTSAERVRGVCGRAR